jgi:hypothetical protein
VSASQRLLDITDALGECGIKYLIMGGHAVRHYGVDRNTLDFDFQIAGDHYSDLERRLSQAALFRGTDLKPGVSWRPKNFCRFQIGALPNGREEWLEFWLSNHLLGPFPDVFPRREEVTEGGRTLFYLSLPDLIRSKETERDDDWSDVRLLEEILDSRHLEKASSRAERVLALAQLRSRRGFEAAEAAGLFGDPALLRDAVNDVNHPVTAAYLLPFLPNAQLPLSLPSFDPAVTAALRQIEPGSTRHLALAEAVRLAYQRGAKAADRADKEQQRS